MRDYSAPIRLTKKQVAEHYQVGLRTVTEWKRRGWIPSFKIGRSVRFPSIEQIEREAAHRRIQMPAPGKSKVKHRRT